MKRGLSTLEVIGLVIASIFLLIVLFAMDSCRPREKGRQAVCMSNQRQLAQAAIMWAEEHDGKLPAALGWAKTLKADEKLLCCLTQGKSHNGGNSYGYNFAIGGKKIKDIKVPETIVMTADCLNTLADRVLRTPADYDPRHKGMVVCSFVDGHVELIAVPGK